VGVASDTFPAPWGAPGSVARAVAYLGRLHGGADADHVAGVGLEQGLALGTRGGGNAELLLGRGRLVSVLARRAVAWEANAESFLGGRGCVHVLATRTDNLGRRASGTGSRLAGEVELSGGKGRGVGRGRGVVAGRGAHGAILVSVTRQTVHVHLFGVEAADLVSVGVLLEEEARAAAARGHCFLQ